MRTHKAMVDKQNEKLSPSQVSAAKNLRSKNRNAARKLERREKAEARNAVYAALPLNVKLQRAGTKVRKKLEKVVDKAAK